MRQHWRRTLAALLTPAVLAGQSPAAQREQRAPLRPNVNGARTEVSLVAGPRADALRVGVASTPAAKRYAAAWPAGAPQPPPPEPLAPTLAAVGGALGALVGFVGSQVGAEGEEGGRLSRGQRMALGALGGMAVGALVGYALGAIADDIRKVPVR